MSLDMNKEDKQKPKHNPLALEDEPTASAPVSNYILKSNYEKEATFGGYVHSITTASAPEGLLQAYRGYEEAEETEPNSLHKLRGSVYQKRMEAKQSNMLSIDSAIDSVLLDEDMEKEEQADVINNLLQKRATAGDSVEDYAMRTSAYAEGGNPSMMDKNILASVQEYELKRLVSEGMETTIQEITGGASLSDLGSLTRKSVSGQLLMGGAVTEEEGAVADLVSDGVISMVTPLVYGAHYSNLHEKLFPEKYKGLTGEAYQKAKGQVAPGEVIKEIKDYIGNTARPVEERAEKINQLFTYLAEAEGLNGLDENRAMKFMIAGEVLGNFGQVEGFDWDRLFGNVTGVLDATVVGGAVTKVARGSRLFGRNRAIKKLDKINPEAAAAIKGTAVSESTGKVSESIGMSREEIIREMTYPSMPGEEAYRSSVLPYIDVSRFTQASDLITDEQKAQIVIGIQKQVATETITGAHYMPSASTITPVRHRRDETGVGEAARADIEEGQEALTGGTGFVIDAAYSGPLGKGFEGAEDARQAAIDLFPFQKKEDVRVYEVVGDQLSRVDNIEDHVPSTEGSSYVFKINREYEYDSEMVRTFTNLGLPTNTAQNMPGSTTEISGTKAKNAFTKMRSAIASIGRDYLQAPTGREGQHWKEAVTDAFTSQYTMAKNEALLNAPLKKLTELKKSGPGGKLVPDFKGQEKVIQALSDANQKGGWQSYDELVSDYGMTKEQYGAYQAIAELEDLKYLIANKVAYNRNLARGYQTIEEYIDGERVTTTGKILETEDAKDIKTVYDPKQDSTFEIASAEHLESLYENGYKIVQTRGVTKDTNYRLADMNSGFVNVRPLDPNQLPYVPGYFSRIDRNSYFILREGTVVGSAKTLGQAHKRKEELGADKVRFSRDLEDETGRPWEDLRQEALRESSLIFGKRGAEAIEGADVANPIDAAIQSSAILSRLSSSREFTNIWRHRFLNEWGDMLGLRDPSGKGFVWPDAERLESALQNVVDPKVRRDIRDLYDYYNRIEGAKEVMMSRSVVKGGLAMADGLSTVPLMGDKLADFSIRAANIKPISFSRGLAFYTLVASRPMRQLLMQSMQPLLLMSIDPKYMFSKLPSDYTVLTGALLADKHTPGSAIKNSKVLSKAMGMDEAEWKKMFVTMRDSGILQAIDHHTFSRDTANLAGKRFSGEATVFGSTVAGAEKPMQVLKKAGFDAGEYNNMATTYLLAWNKYKKDNPEAIMTSDKTAKEVVALAARYSLGMSGRANTFAYQDGMLSLPMQFFSIQHKAALAWWPKSIGGDKTFTGLQKAGMFASQTALFGTDGVGMSAYVDKFADMTGIEIEHPEDRLALEGGLFDIALMDMFGVTASESFSPSSAGGFYNAVGPMSDIVQVAMRSPVDAGALLMREFAGASGESYSRFGDFFSTISRTFKAKGNDWFNPADYADLSQEDMLLIASSLVSTTTLGSDYMAGKAMMNWGLMMNARGEPLTAATEEEARMRQIFGIRSIEEKAMYDMLYGDTPSTAMLDYNKDSATKDAKAIIETVSKQLAYFGYVADVPRDGPQAKKIQEYNRRVRERVMQLMEPIVAGYSEENRIMFDAAMEKELKALISDESKFSTDIRSFLTGAFEYRHGRKMEGVIRGLEEFQQGIKEGSDDDILLNNVIPYLRSGSFEDRERMMQENIQEKWQNVP